VAPRLLLVLPSTTYRASAFLGAVRRLGADLTVASDHASTFGESRPDDLLALDFHDPDGAARQARAFARTHPVAAVFGVDDETALVAAHIARALNLPHASVDACRAARDKHLQRVLLAHAGAPVPSFTLHRFLDDLAKAAQVTAYPCVLKPRCLAMSRGVIRADDPAAFLVAAERLRGIVTSAGADEAETFLVERFVPGPEFALEGLLRDGRLTVLALFDKPDPMDGPFFAETIYATPSRLGSDDRQALEACVEHAARAIGLDRGPVHAELRLNAEGPWLIELAARPIGGRCSAVLRFGADGGVSLEEVLLREALGKWESGRVGEREREPMGVAVYMIPVPRAGTLRGVSGVDEARRVPWVDDVVITAHPGQALEPVPEGNRYLGFIYARAALPEAAVAAVREAHALLDFELA
jgi:biotin carboxylase